MKILKLIIPVFIFMLCLSCDSNISNDENNEADIELNEDAISLTGTKWKLSGIVNAETGEIKELEPKDCEECYTITIESNNEANIYNINTSLKLNLSNLNPLSEPIDYMLRCEKYYKDGKDYCDSNDFRLAVISTDSYSFTSNELKLFYIPNYYYLLFKPVKP